jgi:hypothetical protein
LSARRCWAASAARALPGDLQLARPGTDAGGPVEQLELGAALLLHHQRDVAVDLLEDAGPRHEGRLHLGEVLDDLVDAAVDDGREADLQRNRQQLLAEDVRQRQPEVLQVVLLQDA